jgi:uncharacterized integral membrane protein
MTEPQDRPLPPEQPPARRGRTARQLLLVALGIFAIVYFVLLVTENRRRVKVDYVFGSGQHRLIWLIVVCGLLGWLLGLGTTYMLRRRSRRQR